MIDRRVFLLSGAMIAAGRALVAGTAGVRDFEQRIFNRVNEIRVHCGSPALAWNDTLWAEASLQSARKAIVQFPGHVDPERGDVAQRLNARGLAWSECGENLFSERGYDDPVNLAIVCWWYSAGHKATMLKAAFTETAVGVAIGPDHRIYATQIFLTPPNREPRAQTRKSPDGRNRRARSKLWNWLGKG